MDINKQNNNQIQQRTHENCSPGSSEVTQNHSRHASLKIIVNKNQI
jgi:hypothetical protein